MKNRKREVVERCVAFNRAELFFLERLVNNCRKHLPNEGPGWAAAALVERVAGKLERATR